MENYSLSDLSAVTNGGGFGGNSAWWIIILFVLIFGNGFGNRDGIGQYATAASQNEILLGQKFDAMQTSINKVGDGLASLGYSQLQQMDNNTASINGNIVSEGRNLQNCCCDLRYEMSNQFANTNANTTAQIQKVLDAISQNKIDSLQSQLNTVQNQMAIQNAVSGVPKINPYMYGIIPTYSGCNCCNV